MTRCEHYHKTSGRRCSARIPDGGRYYCQPHAYGDPCRGCGESKGRKIKVRVGLVVTIDLDSYRLNYGTDDAAGIRRDVRWAIRDAVLSGAVLHDGIEDCDFTTKSGT